MRRGDIWSVAGGKDYAGKPRPVVVLQDDHFDATDSITVCPCTTTNTEAPLFRLPVEPNERNGLRFTCRLMVDKITTISKSKVGTRIGRLDDDEIRLLNAAVIVFSVSRFRRARQSAEAEAIRTRPHLLTFAARPWRRTNTAPLDPHLRATDLDAIRVAVDATEFEPAPYPPGWPPLKRTWFMLHLTRIEDFAE